MVEPTPVAPTTARTLLARTARVQRDGRAPSLVAGVVRDGGLAWSAGRGDVADPHTDVQYRLGSISKTVTAVVVMRLRDEGRLGLDDPLEAHVPGTPFGDRTVGQLLSHLAGASSESPGGWWERVPGGITIDSPRDDSTPSERAASRLVLREWMTNRTILLNDFLDRGEEVLAKDWVEASTISMSNLHLTREQTAELTARIMSVVDEYVVAYRGQRVPGSRPVQTQVNVFPVLDADQIPEEDES